MASPPLNIIREAARAEATGDRNYLKKLLYFFELRVPSRVAGPFFSNTYFFPLVINPNAYTMEEPFTVQATPTLGGGLYVEENGIVQRMIRLKGNTGFKPRKLPGDASVFSVALPVERRSYSRRLSSIVLAEISGQRHFQYLQDAVFRTYADLKRDPETSEETSLIFHNPRDDEHWLVVPQKFVLNREAAGRVLYEYEIELLVVGAESPDADFSEDKPWLEKVKDSRRMINRYVDMATGAIRDLTNTVSEIAGLVDNVVQTINNVTSTINEANAFLEGVTDLIRKPAAVIQSTAVALEAIQATIVNTVANVRSIPSSYINAWRRLEDATNQLGFYPSVFETDAQRAMRDLRDRQERRKAAQAAQGETSPANIDGFDNLGTGALPGEEERARAELQAGSEVNEYTSSQEVTVSIGDTLASLAARFLGDARLWQDIALLNGLKPPYINAQAGADLGGPDSPIPGVLGSGGKISIPSFGRPPQAFPLLPIVGVKQEESFEVQLLGREYLLVETEQRNVFDWAIDVDHGSTDLKKVEGLDNLAQGLVTRVTTEKGHNTLYKRLGTERVIGLNQADVDLETARFRIVEAVAADPRVSTVRRISFEAVEAEPADAVIVDADVEIRGFTQGANIKAIV